MLEFIATETETVMKKRGCTELDREGVRVLLEVGCCIKSVIPIAFTQWGKTY